VLAYVAAALGSMWKAPHVLVFLWLACAGTVVLAPRTGSGAGEPLLRRARHLLHPASVLGALGTLAIVFGYGLLLSRAAPSDNVGRFVLIEFAARVIPHSLGDLVGIVLAVPTLAIIALPASLTAFGLLRADVRAALDERGRRTLSLWLAWLIPAGVFLTIVPAKAGRYWFGVLGAVTLLGALAWWTFAQRRLAGEFERRIRRGIDAAQVVGALLGVGMAAFGALLWTGGVAVRGVPPLPAGPVLLLCGVLLAGFLCVTLRWPWARRLHRTPIVFGVVLLLIKPAHAMVIAPARCASQSWRPQAAQIDEAVPTDATIHVLSDKPGNTRSGEFADFGWYCRHPLRWLPSIDVVLQSSPERTLYLLVREKGRERMIERFGQRVGELLEIPRESDHVWLLRLDRDGS
jgi:hypothetical protein